MLVLNCVSKGRVRRGVKQSPADILCTVSEQL